MSYRFACCFGILVLTGLLSDRALALVVETSVTPASVKASDSRFSVTAEKDRDGLIQFSITYRLPTPQYLVAHFELRDGETSLARTDTPSFVREDSATYHVALSPRQLSNATFVLSENGFVESAGHPVALPGGTIFHVDLQAFGKDAVKRGAN